MLTGMVLAFFSFILFLLMHIYVFHFKPPKKRFRTLIYILVFSILVYTILFFLVNKSVISAKINEIVTPGVADILNGLFIFFFIYYFYFHLIVVFDRSVTPRMMMEADNAPGKKIKYDELKANYSLEDKFKKELIDMDEMDRIKSDNGRYYNTPKGQAHADIMEFLREFLHIGGHQ